MAKANALNTSLSNCTGLPLATGVSGDIPLTSLASGTNASSSTYYSSEGWLPPPVINPGAQDSLAYYATSSNALSPFTNVANCVFIGGTTPSWVPMTDGQVLLAAASGVRWAAVNITATNGIQVLNGSNSVQISYVMPLNDVTGSSATMSIMNGYLANNSTLVTLTLPASAIIGSTLVITGKNTGGWTIAQNAGQTIIVGSVSSTVGVTGSVSSASPTDSMELICLVANTTWAVAGAPQSSGLIIV